MRLKSKGLRIAVCLLALCPASPAGAQPRQTSAEGPEPFFKKMVHPGEPGFAVLISSDGRAEFKKGFGVRDLKSQAPITAQTNFRLASFTKQFTAMAIMLLVSDGKLRYGERLTEIVSEFPAYGRPITIRHLLTHTSGLPDYEDLMDREEKTHGQRWTPEHQIQDDEVLALLERETKGKFAPGTSWAYSNSAYVVLGMIVARVSGSSYREFLQRRIFGPLGMHSTVVYQKGVNEVPQRAFGHSLENGKFLETDQSATSATLGDGGIYSNLEDLSKWDDALAHHRLVSEQEMQPALVPVKLNDGSQTYWPSAPDGDNLDPGKPVAYGFGWFLDPYRGRPRMWHSGSSIGFRTVIERFPSRRLTIVILCNRADLEPAKLALEVAAVYLEKGNSSNRTPEPCSSPGRRAYPSPSSWSGRQWRRTASSSCASADTV
jgi:CubicO group peptidase (beta-lactamase class C family)